MRRLKSGRGSPGASDTALADAETTLKRLRERQIEEAAADAATAALDGQTGIADRLETAGFGRRTRPTTADVLDRLRRRSADAPAATTAAN